MADNRASIIITATNATQAAFNAVNKGLNKISGIATSTSSKVLALAGIGGFGALIKSSFDTVDALNNAAQKIGITTSKLQAMQYAAQLFSAGGAEAMNEALTKASKRLGEFNQTGGGAAAGWLKELKLDTQALASLSPDELFKKYSQAIGGMNDRGKQLAAISALMGDESRSLIGIIDEGADAFNKAQKELQDFGIALTDVDTAKIDIANNAWDRTKTLLTGLGQQISIALTPVLTILNDKIGNTAKEAGGMGALVQAAMRKVLVGIGWVRDAVFYLQIGFKNIEAAVVDFAASAVEKVATAAESFRQFSKVLHIDVEPFTGLNQKVQELHASSTDLQNQIILLYDQAKPSEELLAKYDEMAAKIEKQAQALAKANAEQAKLNSSQKNLPETKQTRTEFDQGFKAAQENINAINEQFMTEQQLLDEHLAQRQFTIEDDFQQGYITEQERKKALEQLEIQHQATLLQIQTDYDKQRAAAEQKVQDDIRGMRENALSNAASLLQMFAGKSKAAAIAAIAINKGLSIARAVQNTGVAVTNALASIPYPANLAAAAQMKTLGAINVALIAASGFAQAASLGGGGVSGGGAVSGNTTPPQSAATQLAQIERKQTRIKVIGARAGQLIDSADIAEAFRQAHDSDEVVLEIESSGERVRVY